MKFKQGVSDINLKPALIMWLDLAEQWSGEEFFITSGWREFGGHADGWKVDIRAWDEATRFRIVAALLAAGFRWIILYDRHVHADRDPSRVGRYLGLGGKSK